jgi:hypothetical protein
MPWLNRVANLFRGRKLHAEIDEELRFHMDARIADNLAAGITPEDARRDAARRFGGQLLALEKSRDADIVVWIETIGQDVRYAWRSLRRNPGVSAVALASLALALGANTAIFSVVNAVLLRALPYKDADRLAVVWSTSTLNGSLDINTSVPNFEDWKSRSRSFADMAAYRDADAPLILRAIRRAIPSGSITRGSRAICSGCSGEARRWAGFFTTVCRTQQRIRKWLS